MPSVKRIWKAGLSSRIQKNAFATYLAGKIYLTEEGFQDVPKAIRYLESAWEMGNHYAGYQLGKLYLYGREVEADQEKAIAYLTASAELATSMQNNCSTASEATGTGQLQPERSVFCTISAESYRTVSQMRGKEKGEG